MFYSYVIKGVFISRPNRFIAHVEINGKDNIVHVKNTGRCKELLIPGCTVYLEKSNNPNRKTLYDLIAVVKEYKGNKKRLINMDSLAPNKVAREWIYNNKQRFPYIFVLKPEYTYGDSRFDFYIEYEDLEYNLHKMLLEVKGCTLENNNIASFPDAPTERGLKHIRELTEIHNRNEFECAVLFVIQMKGVTLFKPNWNMHEAFCIALQNAQKAGVEIFAVDCKVTPDSLMADENIKIDLLKEDRN